MFKKLLIFALVIFMVTFFTGCQKEEDTVTQTNNEDVALNTMSVSEFKAMSDDGKLKYQSQIKEFFGDPDATTTENGRDVWLYFDRLHSTSGALQSIRFAFYTTEDLIKFSAGLGLKRDASDFEEIQVSITEIKSKDFYKEKYGIK